jgi:transposase InsO family protein
MPAFTLRRASDEFKDKTVRVNEMWQTDFTYFKIPCWGWYYLSTVLDDYSRFIVHWQLCKSMQANDVEDTLNQAMLKSNLRPGQSPKSEINLRLLNFNENSIKKSTTFNYQKVSTYF